MKFDPNYIGVQAANGEDARYLGSKYSEIRSAVFADRYYRVWGAASEPPLPVYGVTLRHALAGLFRRWRFQQASDRSVDVRSDMRWGEGRGFRRILHPNGVCLFGTWEIDEPEAGNRPYTGAFRPGTKALTVARYSVCCTETRRGHNRSLSMVGKLFPTADPGHDVPLKPANFITQEDLGGSRSNDIADVELRNAPDITPWKRGWALPVLLVTGLVLRRTDREPGIRQLYEIAELGKSPAQPTCAPQFMRLVTSPTDQPLTDNLDFREEILARIYDRGDGAARRELTFHIEVADEGHASGLLRKRWTIAGWKRIGRITFREAAASYGGDFVLHFPHPAWREDRNDSRTAVRPNRKKRKPAWQTPHS